MKTKNRLTRSATILGLAFAMLGSSATSGHAQGKLEAAVEGGKLALEYGEKLATLLTGLSRGAPIVIANHTKRNLTNLRIYTDSGKVLELDGTTRIPAGTVGGVTVAKSDLALRGAVGLISYDIEGVDQKFFLMYSIPYDQLGTRKDTKNWFYARAHTETGGATEKLFNDFYVGDEIREAGRGLETWTYGDSASSAYQTAMRNSYNAIKALQRGDSSQLQATKKALEDLPTRWVIKGTMVNAGVSKIVIDLYDEAESPGSSRE